MATKPTEEVLILAQDDVNLSTGFPNKELPDLAKRTTGYDETQVVTAEDINYWGNNHGKWLTYLEETTDDLNPRVTTLENEMDSAEGRLDNLEDTTFTAGNGLTGGGTLAEDRTFTLGTPTTLDGSTTNNVTTDSHTHQLSMASQAEAEARTDNTKLMTPLRTDEAIVASFTPLTGTSKSSVQPNGLIMNWDTITLPVSDLVWVEHALATPYTTAHFSVVLGINGQVGGVNDNSNVSIRPSIANPLTHIEVQQVGQVGAITYISIGL